MKKAKTKIKELIKNNKPLILGIITGLILSGTTVYGATILFDSDEVSYDDTKVSGTLGGTDVQTALDELYDKTMSCICLDKNGTYIVGSTITFGGKSYTVVANNTNDVALAYNGTVGSSSGNTYDNANTYLKTNFLDTDETLLSAKKGGCLVNQGTTSNPVYVTTDSGLNSTSISNEYWIGSYQVNVPSLIYSYSLSYANYYSGWGANYDGEGTYPPPVVSGATSYSSSVAYSAGSTALVSNTNTTATYTNASVSASGTLTGSTYVTKLMPRSGTSSVVCWNWQIYTIDGSYNSGVGWSTGTRYAFTNADFCGNQLPSTFIHIVARNSSTFIHRTSGGDGYMRYTKNYNYYFAGFDYQPTYNSSNNADSYHFSGNNHSCYNYTTYSTSSTIKSIYYRPYIKVLKK